jgi:hypothetical protein
MSSLFNGTSLKVCTPPLVSHASPLSYLHCLQECVDVISVPQTWRLRIPTMIGLDCKPTTCSSPCSKEHSLSLGSARTKVGHLNIAKHELLDAGFQSVQVVHQSKNCSSAECIGQMRLSKLLTSRCCGIDSMGPDCIQQIRGRRRIWGLTEQHHAQALHSVDGCIICKTPQRRRICLSQVHHRATK